MVGVSMRIWMHNNAFVGLSRALTLEWRCPRNARVATAVSESKKLWGRDSGAGAGACAGWKGRYPGAGGAGWKKGLWFMRRLRGRESYAGSGGAGWENSDTGAAWKGGFWYRRRLGGTLIQASAAPAGKNSDTGPGGAVAAPDVKNLCSYIIYFRNYFMDWVTPPQIPMCHSEVWIKESAKVKN